MLLALAGASGAFAQEMSDEEAVEILVDQGYVKTVSENTPLGEEAFSDLAKYPSGQTADGQVILSSVNPDAIDAVKDAGGQIPSAEETGGVLSLSLNNEVAVTVVAEGAAVEFASAISPILKIDGTNTYLYATDVKRVQPSVGGADYTATVVDIDKSDEEMVKIATMLYWGFGGQGYQLNGELLQHTSSDTEIQQMYIGTWVALRWAIGELDASNVKVTGNPCAQWLVNNVWAEQSRHVDMGTYIQYQPYNNSVTPLVGQVVRQNTGSVVPGPGSGDKTGNLRIVLTDVADSNHFLPGASFTIIGTGGYTRTETTNANGWADFSAVPIDTYIIMQERAPSGYAAITDPVSFTLEALDNQTTFQVLNLTNAVNEAKLRIVSHITGDQTMILPGGSYSITNQTTGQVYGPYSADQEGKIEITGITVGDYKVERLACPDGYEPNPSDPGPWYVKVSSKDLDTGATNGWTVLYVPADPLDSSFRIHLQDSADATPIEGAAFELCTFPEGKNVGYGRTNAQGEVVFSGLDNDVTYQLHQISTTRDYSIPREQEYQNIKTDLFGRQVPITVVNDYIGHFGGIGVTVTDSETGEPVRGVELRAYSIQTNGYLPKSVFTEANGKAVFENLPEGGYSVVVISVPAGYKAPTDNRHPVTVVQNTAVETSFEISPVREKGRVEVTAVDETDMPVQGVVFRLKKYPYYAKDGYRSEVSTNEFGKAYFFNLEDGDYELEYVRVPEGYTMQTTGSKIMHAKVNTTDKATFTLKADDPNYGKLEVTQLAGNGQYPLPAVRFQVFSVKMQRIVEENVTGENGKVTFILPEGEYILKQSYIPSNYVADTKDRYIQIRKGRTSQEVYVAPDFKEYGGIEIVNYAENSINGLGGAEFEIWSADGKERVSGPKATNAKGVATFASVEAGSYIVKQVKAASGYEISPVEKDVQVTLNHTSRVMFYSQKTPEVKGSISLHIVDAESGAPLSGAGFALYRGSTLAYGPFYSGPDGYISASGLDLGSYNLVEMAAPNGYGELKTHEGFVLNAKEPKLARSFTYRKSPAVTGQIRVENIDKTTNTAVTGGSFSLYSANGAYISTMRTNGSGVAMFTNIPVGSYIVRQVGRPDGFKLNTEAKSAVITGSDTVNLVFENEPEVTTGRIGAYCYDISNGNVPLGNVQVGLYSSLGILQKTAFTNIYGECYFEDVPFGVYIVRQLTVADGYDQPEDVRLYLRQEKPEIRAEFRNKRTDMTWYYPPKGDESLEGQSDTIKQEVSEQSTASTQVKDENIQNTPQVEDQSSQAQAESAQQVKDEGAQTIPAEANIEVKAQAADTGDSLTDLGFAVENESGETVAENTITAENGFMTTPLPLGKYSIRVTSVPEGFAEPEETQDVELSEAGSSEEVVMTIDREDPAQSAVINVYARNAQGEPLADVEFAILNPDGQAVAGGKTDQEGLYRSISLAPGNYIVRQISALSGYDAGGDREVEVLDGTDLTVEFVNLRKEQIHIEGSIQKFSNRYHTASMGDTITLIETITGTETVSGSKQIQVAMTVDPRLEILPNHTVRMIVRNDTDNELMVGQDYIATVNPGSGQITVDMTAAGIKKFEDLAGERIDIMVDTKLSASAAVSGNFGVPITHKAQLNQVDSFGKVITQESNEVEVHTTGVNIHLETEDTGAAINGVHFKVYRSQEDAINGVNPLLTDDGQEYVAETDVSGNALIAPIAYGESTHPYNAGGRSVYYLVQQDTIPTYIKASEPIRVEASASSGSEAATLIKNSRIRASVGFSVLGSDTGREIKGAALRLVSGTDVNGTQVISEWLTSESDIVRYPLLPGDYCLVQTSAPFGYTSAPAIIFRVTENSVDQLVDGVYVPVENGLIQMTDRKTQPAPETDGTETPGKVTVTFGKDKTGQDKDQTSVELYDGTSGNKVHEWTSKVPYSVDLDPGIYTFTETGADGSSTTTTFRVNQDGTVDVKDGNNWIPSDSSINTTTSWSSALPEDTTTTVTTGTESTGTTTQTVQTGSNSSTSDSTTPEVKTTQTITTEGTNVSTGVLSTAAIACIALLGATGGLIVSRKLKNLN